MHAGRKTRKAHLLRSLPPPLRCWLARRVVANFDDISLDRSLARWYVRMCVRRSALLSHIVTLPWSSADAHTRDLPCISPLSFPTSAARLHAFGASTSGNTLNPYAFGASVSASMHSLPGNSEGEEAAPKSPFPATNVPLASPNVRPQTHTRPSFASPELLAGAQASQALATIARKRRVKRTLVFPSVRHSNALRLVRTLERPLHTTHSDHRVRLRAPKKQEGPRNSCCSPCIHLYGHVPYVRSACLVTP